MYFLALPIMVESHQVLKLWLGNPPDQADTFVIWTILSTFSTLLGNTLVTLQMAHGNIRHYQVWITIFGCIPFPLTWLAFKMGAPAIVAYYIYVAVYWGLIFVRYHLVHGMTGIPAKMYLIGVILRTHVIGILAAFPPLFVHWYMPETLLRLIIVGLVSIFSSSLFIYLFGLEKVEKDFIIGKLKSKLAFRTKHNRQ